MIEDSEVAPTFLWLIGSSWKMFRCGNRECDQPGNMRCTKCSQEGFPKNIGRYCCRSCQQRDWLNNHKTLHKLCTPREISSGIKETMLLLLHQFHISEVIPRSDEREFTIVFLGARDIFEGSENYFELFRQLKHHTFPELEKLNIFLIGLEVPSKQTSNGPVTVTSLSGRAEQHLTPALLVNGIAVMFQPGLSEFTDSWREAISMLRDWNVLTVVSSYSNAEHKTYDAVHDEGILSNYFGVKIILPSFLNPSRKLHNRGVYKNCFVFAFRGRNDEPDLTLWNDEELQREKRLAFLGSLVIIFDKYEDNPEGARSCERFADDLRAGRITVDPSVTLQTMEFQALAYDLT